MEYRPLKIKLLSAQGLKDVNLFSKMHVYTEVSIAGYRNSKQKTSVDMNCGTSPKWNHRMEFIVYEPYLTKPGLVLLFKLKARSSFFGDKEIGSVTVPIKDLFQGNSFAEERFVEYQVRTKSGKAKGSLKFAYNFGEKFTHRAETNDHGAPMAAYPSKHAEEPVTVYPPAAPYGGMSYPPQYPPGGYHVQSSGYGYHAPPPPGYGYHPHPGYGYPHAGAGYGGYPPVHMGNKSSMGGAGIGLGIGAGLLGGLLIGDMVSDVGEAAAYAAGYGDAMGGMDF